MTVTIRQIGPCFAGEVGGIDMTRKLTSDEVAAIHAGMDQYAVLVFHNQSIDDDQQLAFSRSLGEIEMTLNTGLRAESEYRLPPTFADVSNLDQHHKPMARDDRRRAVQPRQPAVAFRQLVQGDPRQIFAAARAQDPVKGRQHRVCGYARRLGCARPGHPGAMRASRLRAQSDLFAPADRLFRPERRGARALQAGAPDAGAHPSGDRPQVTVSRLACRCDRRLADPRGARLSARPHRTRHPARLRLLAQMGGWRLGDVGQPPDHASRPPVPARGSPRRSPHDDRRRRPDLPSRRRLPDPRAPPFQTAEGWFPEAPGESDSTAARYPLRSRSTRSTSLRRHSWTACLFQI
jgi:hypothetical protein